MFKQLLLPLDMTDKHDKAVQTAIGFARQPGVSVTLLHVIELIPGLPREEEREFYERLEKKAQRHLDKIGHALEAQKVPWKAVVLLGQRVQETIRFAQDNHADLIVLTSPAFDVSHPTAGWGSTSFKIGVLATMPVLLVKV